MKEIMKSTLILLVITLVSGFLLGFVNDLTKDSIEERNIEAKTASLQSVVGDEFRVALDEKVKIDQPEGSENIEIEEAYKVYDESDVVAGMVLLLFTSDCYGDEMELSLGILQSDKKKDAAEISGIDFLSLNETPGLGMNADEEEFKAQFKHQDAEALQVTKNTPQDQEIEAISGATITSNAVTNAVNPGLAFYNQVKEEL